MRNVSLTAGLLGLAAIFVTSPNALAQSRWRESQPMENGRSHLAAAAIGGDIYVAGGARVLGPIDTFEVYEASSDLWMSLPSLPGAREQFGMAAIAGEIYVSGGYTGDAAPSAELWIYSVEQRQWRQAPSMPSGRAGHVLVSFGDKLYVVGGDGPEPASIYAFDPAEQKWSTVPITMPVPRSGLAAAVVGKEIFLLGGTQLGQDVLARVDVVDIASGEWRRAADMPAARAGIAAAVLDGRIHVAGGATFKPSHTYLDHYVYNPSTNSWMSAPPMLTPRFASASAIVNGEWYVIGGGVGAGFFAPFTAADAVESYAP